MRRVIIESPYAGDIKGNTEYLKRCLRDSIDRGEAPLASHLLYPFVLREDLRDERQLGIELGFEWWYGARCIVFYIDKGWSEGMLKAHERAERFGKDIEVRKLHMLDTKYVHAQMPETLEFKQGSWWKRIRQMLPRIFMPLPVQPAREPETSGENSELPINPASIAVARIDDRATDDGEFINSTLAREAPPPVPWGEAKS